MFDSKVDYLNTVKTRKLVYDGQKSDKIHSYIFCFIIVVWGLSTSFMASMSIFDKNSSQVEYLMAFIFPLIILTVVYFLCYDNLTRDKLVIFETSNNLETSKIILLQAAKNLGWEIDDITDNYMVFITKYDLIKSYNTVTLIIFPDEKIYFNCMNTSQPYVRFARFMGNYEDLINEYQRIEKEEKLLPVD